VPLATVRGCTWYFRLPLKGTIGGVIVGVRSPGERSDGPGRGQAPGLRAKEAETSRVV